MPLFFSPRRERTLTELDHARLSHLIDVHRVSHWQQADVVPSRQVAPDVVTLYSLIEVQRPGQAAREKLALCYPADAEPDQGFISVLSPMGMALLGLRLGDTARWHEPTGEPAQATIVAMLFQPESSGDYTT